MKLTRRYLKQVILKKKKNSWSDSSNSVIIVYRNLLLKRKKDNVSLLLNIFVFQIYSSVEFKIHRLVKLNVWVIPLVRRKKHLCIACFLLKRLFYLLVYPRELRDSFYSGHENVVQKFCCFACYWENLIYPEPYKTSRKKNLMRFKDDFAWKRKKERNQEVKREERKKEARNGRR